MMLPLGKRAFFFPYQNEKVNEEENRNESVILSTEILF